MKVAVSACLLGEACRYDGASKPCAAALQLLEMPNVNVIPICPEVAGGLPTPRPASEIVAGAPDLLVRNTHGEDVTAAFVRGAEATLALMAEHGCELAVLKAKSPSCGKSHVYDGSFSRRLVEGSGVTAALLMTHGIRVVDEAELACGTLADRIPAGCTPTECIPEDCAPPDCVPPDCTPPL